MLLPFGSDEDEEAAAVCLLDRTVAGPKCANGCIGEHVGNLAEGTKKTNTVTNIEAGWVGIE